MTTGTGLDPVEQQLREALEREAHLITPRERLPEILAQAARLAVDPDAHAAPGGLPGPDARPRRWLVPAAAAAAVAVLAGGVWGATALLGPSAQAPPAAPPAVTAPATTGTAATTAATSGTGSTTTTVPRGSASSTPTAATTPTPTTSAPGVGTPGVSTTAVGTPTVRLRALPVYFIDPELPMNRMALYRGFAASTVGESAPPGEVAKAALTLALSHAGCATEDPCPYWAGVRVERVRVADGAITIVLAGTENPELGLDAARLAVQQLVWTAQAAVGQGPLPVRFERTSGMTTPLFSALPLDRDYTRPPAGQEYADLASLWIESPAEHDVLPVGATVSVSGSACPSERLAYTLRRERDDLPVRAGTIAVGTTCPVRGPWHTDLGVLEPGDYLFTVTAGRPFDGDEDMTRGTLRFSVR